MKKSYFPLSLFSILLIWQCANPVPPSGGPKDEIAPQVVKAESTPNGLTNYIPQETEITFDEFVVLRNPARNIIISPPVDPKPEFFLSGKTVVIDWTETDSLHSNTTYTVNFANAVEDLNEGNPLTDFTFAFSTGPTLDSLSWEVEVIDKTGTGQEGITVMLYDEMSDSVVRKQLPYYFAKTDENGIAHFSFLREGTYKAFALKDDNLTLTYDLPTEAIGFLNNPVQIPSDTTQVKQILLFTPQPDIILAERPFYAKNKIVFLFTPLDTSVDVQALDSSQVYGHRWIADSLCFWPKREVRDSIRFKWKKDKETNSYSIVPKDSFNKMEPYPIDDEILFIKKKAMIQWSTPIKNPGDSVFFSLDSNNHRYFFQTIKHADLHTMIRIPTNDWPGRGRIYIRPNQLSSQYGGNNSDTLNIAYTQLSSEDMGELALQFSNAQRDTALIVRLVQGNRILKQQYFQNDTSYTWYIDNLQPGKYLLRLIVDENKNGKQDDGNYWEQQQPELPVEYELPKLRANWTLEEEINIEHAIKGR